MTPQFDELDDVLAELRQKHRQIATPPHLETRLRAATRPVGRRSAMWRWGWAAVAAVAITVGVWQAQQAKAPEHLRTVADVGDRLSDFVALPGSETLPPSMETSILRVQLSKGDLRQYGFDIPSPVAAELIRADFVVGDDGLARAIRFVR